MTLADDIKTITKTKLVTARYQDFKPDLGIPVRSSVGAPRFWRFGPLAHSRATTPYGVFRNDDLRTLQAQHIAYHARLDELGDEVVTELADIARDHPGEGPLVLLCYENVHAGGDCHRRWFAEWFEDHYGIVVPEADV